MTTDEIDTLWSKALDQSRFAGEQLTRQIFAKLITDSAREQYKRTIWDICKDFGKTGEVIWTTLKYRLPR